MYVRVLLHVRLLVEPLAAVLAGVGPCVGVDQQVGGQRGRPCERLAAHFALKALLLKSQRKSTLRTYIFNL